MGSASFLKILSDRSWNESSLISFRKARTQRSNSSAVCRIWLSTELRNIRPTASISEAWNSIVWEWWKEDFLNPSVLCTRFASETSYSTLLSVRQALQKHMSSKRRFREVWMRRGNSSGRRIMKFAIPLMTANRRCGRYLTMRLSTCIASSRTPGSILIPCWGIIPVILSLRPASSTRYGIHFRTERNR